MMNGFNIISKERAMSISLDEYIEECKMFQRSDSSSENQNESVSWKDDESPKFIKIYENNTLEQIIRNTNKSEENEPWITKNPSQQWRLQRYKDNNRPIDMPPLISVDQQNAPFYIKNRKKPKRFNNCSGQKRKKILTTTQIWSSDPFSPNKMQNGQINSDTNSYPVARNETNNVCPNNFPVNSMMTVQSSALKSSYDLINNNRKQITNITGDINVKNNNCVQIVTEIANTLLKQVQKEISDHNTNNRNINKYDINIQKQLSAFQNKPFIYKCPGGGIISQDGSGVNDCVVIPKQTGVSMNQRFA